MKKYDPVKKQWTFTVGVGKDQCSVRMSDLAWQQLKKYHGGGLAAEKLVCESVQDCAQPLKKSEVVL